MVDWHSLAYISPISGEHLTRQGFALENRRYAGANSCKYFIYKKAKYSLFRNRCTLQMIANTDEFIVELICDRVTILPLGVKSSVRLIHRKNQISMAS
jgi:hypothetical protein